jgi:hypothetical protein
MNFKTEISDTNVRIQNEVTETSFKCPFCLISREQADELIEHLVTLHFLEMKKKFDKFYVLEDEESGTSFDTNYKNSFFDECYSNDNISDESPSNDVNNQETFRRKSDSDQIVTNSQDESRIPKNSPLYCKICFRGFDYTSSLFRHLKFQHRVLAIKDLQANVGKNKNVANGKKLVDHGIKPYLCSKCGLRSNNLAYMQNHLQVYNHGDSCVTLSDNEAAATVKDYLKNRGNIIKKISKRKKNYVVDA